MESDEEFVWCKAACGQNFHKECFEQWKRSKHGGRVTCVYCRSEWQERSPKKGPLASLISTAPDGRFLTETSDIILCTSVMTGRTMVRMVERGLIRWAPEDKGY